MQEGHPQELPSLQEPLLVVPSTVLCSEMGVHMAPCGRFLAACVALPQVRCRACMLCCGARHLLRLHLDQPAQQEPLCAAAFAWGRWHPPRGVQDPPHRDPGPDLLQPLGGQQRRQQQQLAPLLQHEVQVLSLEQASRGEVLARAPVQAAHCLTSVQFSPSSRFLLLAYGRWVLGM